MDTAKVTALKHEILALPDAERQELAREVLPTLLMTPAGLGEIDTALQSLPTEDLDALVERARARAADLTPEHVADLIAEALRAARAQGRS